MRSVGFSEKIGLRLPGKRASGAQPKEKEDHVLHGAVNCGFDQQDTQM